MSRGREFFAGENISGGYRLGEIKGRGRYGTVYGGTDVENGDLVAVKIFDHTADPDNVLDEARDLQSIQSPHVIRYRRSGVQARTEYGLEGSQTRRLYPFIVTDHAEGDLEEKVRGGRRLQLEEALDTMTQGLTGLHDIHEAGLIHRDFRPANLLVAKNQILVGDLGSAIGVHAGLTPQVAEGHPEFTPPEQAQGLALVESDIYAAGITMFQLLTGKKPFTGLTHAETMPKHASDIPQSFDSLLGVSMNETYAEIEYAISRALAKEVADRPESAEAFRELLREAHDRGQIRDKRKKKAFEFRGSNRTDQINESLADLLVDPHLPKWEQGRRRNVTVDIDFKERGEAIIHEGDIVAPGEVCVSVYDANNQQDVIGVYEGAPHQQDMELGFDKYRGARLPKTRMTTLQYADLQDSYREWSSGDDSNIREEEQRLRENVYNQYVLRPIILTDGTSTTVGAFESTIQEYKELRKAKDANLPYDEARLEQIMQMRDNNGRFWRPDPDNESWRIAYDKALDTYGTYVASNNILLFERIDYLKKNPPEINPHLEGEYPEWQDTWAPDHETIRYLQQIAEQAGLQLDTQKGMVTIHGHTATGKDVLVDMFAHITGRPLYTFSGDTWRTVDDLLEGNDLHRRSIETTSERLIRAVTTPGAIVYIDTINAMPQRTQADLYSVIENRVMKLPDGTTMEVDPSVIVTSSMQPDYPGLYPPFADMRSQMDYVPVPYTELTDPAQPEKFNYAEAWRIARTITSLAEASAETNPKDNDFIKMWKKYVDKMDIAAPPMTKTQEFDLETVFILLQYTKHLRDMFHMTQDHTDQAEIEVGQPLTINELLASARSINRISDDEKEHRDPLEEAKKLLKKHYTPKLMFTNQRSRRAVEQLIDNPPREWNIQEIEAFAT